MQSSLRLSTRERKREDYEQKKHMTQLDKYFVVLLLLLHMQTIIIIIFIHECVFVFACICPELVSLSLSLMFMHKTQNTKRTHTRFVSERANFFCLGPYGDGHTTLYIPHFLTFIISSLLINRYKSIYCACVIIQFPLSHKLIIFLSTFPQNRSKSKNKKIYIYK